MSARVKPATGPDGTKYVSFKCPGCNDQHMLPVTGPKAWGFNGSTDRPVITPSILCRYSGVDPDTDAPINKVCHSFVGGSDGGQPGRIEFLNDCTHALAGQTVDLAEIE